MFWHWLLHYTGGDNGSGPWYLELSGFVGDLVFVGAGWGIVRKHNCHVKGCWRLGHPDPDHGWPACRRHHSQAHKLGG